VPVGVGEKRPVEIVILHLGDATARMVEADVARFEFAYRERDIGASEIDDGTFAGLLVALAFPNSRRIPAQSEKLKSPK
jgi:hypothetical protein